MPRTGARTGVSACKIKSNKHKVKCCSSRVEDRAGLMMSRRYSEQMTGDLIKLLACHCGEEVFRSNFHATKKSFVGRFWESNVNNQTKRVKEFTFSVLSKPMRHT